MSAEHVTIRVATGRAEPALGAGPSPGSAPPQPSQEKAANGQSSARPQAEAAVTARPTQSPPTDIHETPEGLVLEADLPGAGESDVMIRLEDNVLSLQARVTPVLPAGARPLYQEAPAVEFARSFILSDEVDRTRITAELKQGVLRLWLPRADRTRTRRIEVKTP